MIRGTENELFGLKVLQQNGGVELIKKETTWCFNICD
jgi:hypothetical protein